MGGADRKPLVLLVECDVLIGLDLSEALIQAGYRVAGPATTLERAAAILGRAKPDVAVLEAALDDGDCTALARALHRDGVPFLVHSQYSRDEYSADDFRGAPWLLKPALSRDVISTVNELSLANMRA